MGKVSEYYREAAESDYYEHLMWEEHERDIEAGIIPYQLTKAEEKAYKMYMEGKLCGNQDPVVHTSIGSNLRNGQSITGSNATLKYRKRKSVE